MTRERSIGPHPFQTTRWSVVLAATTPDGDSRDALESLCASYWFPIYAFVRRRGHAHAEAEDLVQAFFARLIEKRDWRVDPSRGRFRSFLVAALGNFLENERDHRRAAKRGGGAPQLSLDADADHRFARESIDDATPEALFEKQLALRLLDDALDRLRDEQARAGKSAQVDQLRPFLGADAEAPPYAELAMALGATEGALRVALHRLRRRYAEILRFAVGDLVSDPADVESEISALIAALSR